MTGFHPATIELQREALTATRRDLDRDRRLLTKQPEGSRSKMAVTLRGRIAEGERVAGDLRTLIAFMEALVEHAELRAVVEPCSAADLGPGYTGGDLRRDETVDGAR